jgi:hypothetical protein
MTISNLHLYLNKQDYESLAGPDWPQYENFLQGQQSKIPEVQEEIDNFVKMFKKDGIKFPIKTKTACQSKWTWSTIYLNQLSTASCHRVNPVPFALEEPVRTCNVTLFAGLASVRNDRTRSPPEFPNLLHIMHFLLKTALSLTVPFICSVLECQGIRPIRLRNLSWLVGIVPSLHLLELQ